MPHTIISEDDFEASTHKPNEITIPTEPDLINTDLINNTKQKESALSKSGITRLKAFKVVAEALTAEKWTDGIVDGMVKRIQVPDYDRRQWAAEMAAKYFGDLVTTKENNDTGIRQLVIIRAGSETFDGKQKETKDVPRQFHIQSEDVPRDVQLMGHGKDDVIDISGNAIQRADTE